MSIHRIEWIFLIPFVSFRGNEFVEKLNILRAASVSFDFIKFAFEFRVLRDTLLRN